MKCAICNKEDEIVTHAVTDCSECQSIIRDTVAGYENLDDKEELVIEYG